MAEFRKAKDIRELLLPSKPTKRAYALSSSLKNKGSGVVSPEPKATKQGSSPQKGSKARGSAAERGPDKGRKEEETAGGTKRMKTLEEAKQNNELMEGVARTTEAIGDATGNQEKPLTKVSFENPAPGIQIREISKAAKKSLPQQEAQQLPAQAVIGNNASERPPRVAIQIEDDPTADPYKFQKIMELVLVLDENTDPSAETRKKLSELISLIKIVDPTAAILPHTNRSLPLIKKGRELPILHTRLREYFKFTSPAYQF